MIEGGRPRTVVSAGSLAVWLDEQQYELGSGECLDAAVSGGTITVVTTDPDNAYPEFSRVAAGHGITQVLSTGMLVRDRRAAGLNMYAARAQPISADSVALATTLAGYAGVAVSNASLHQVALDEAHQSA